MKNILKTAIAAVATAACTVVVKQRTQEVGLVLSLAVRALVLTMVLGTVESTRALMGELGEAADLSPAVLAPMLETVGVAILAHISAEVCRDAKESGITAFVETAGVAVALCAVLPLLRMVLGAVTELP